MEHKCKACNRKLEADSPYFHMGYGKTCFENLPAEKQMEEWNKYYALISQQTQAQYLQGAQDMQLAMKQYEAQFNQFCQYYYQNLQNVPASPALERANVIPAQPTPGIMDRARGFLKSKFGNRVCVAQPGEEYVFIKRFGDIPENTVIKIEGIDVYHHATEVKALDQNGKEHFFLVPRFNGYVEDGILARSSSSVSSDDTPETIQGQTPSPQEPSSESPQESPKKTSSNRYNAGDLFEFTQDDQYYRVGGYVKITGVEGDQYQVIRNSFGLPGKEKQANMSFKQLHFFAAKGILEQVTEITKQEETQTSKTEDETQKEPLQVYAEDTFFRFQENTRYYNTNGSIRIRGVQGENYEIIRNSFGTSAKHATISIKMLHSMVKKGSLKELSPETSTRKVNNPEIGSRFQQKDGTVIEITKVHWKPMLNDIQYVYSYKTSYHENGEYADEQFETLIRNGDLKPFHGDMTPKEITRLQVGDLFENENGTNRIEIIKVAEERQSYIIIEHTKLSNGKMKISEARSKGFGSMAHLVDTGKYKKISNDAWEQQTKNTIQVGEVFITKKAGGDLTIGELIRIDTIGEINRTKDNKGYTRSVVYSHSNGSKYVTTMEKILSHVEKGYYERTNQPFEVLRYSDIPIIKRGACYRFTQDYLTRKAGTLLEILDLSKNNEKIREYTVTYHEDGKGNAQYGIEARELHNLIQLGILKKTKNPKVDVISQLKAKVQAKGIDPSQIQYIDFDHLIYQLKKELDPTTPCPHKWVRTGGSSNPNRGWHIFSCLYCNQKEEVDSTD